MRQKRSIKGGFVTPNNRERPHNRHPLLSLLPATKDVVEKITLPKHLCIRKKKPIKKDIVDVEDDSVESKSPSGLPEKAKMARQRAPAQVKVGLKQKFCHGHMNATPEPKRITAEYRLGQFPNQSFIANPHAKGLICQACCLTLPLKKSDIFQHITRTKKHVQALQAWKTGGHSQKVKKDAIVESEMSGRVYGDTLPDETKLFVLMSFMR